MIKILLGPNSSGKTYYMEKKLNAKKDELISFNEINSSFCDINYLLIIKLSNNLYKNKHLFL